MSKEKETYLEHLESKVEDLQLENELMLVKLKTDHDKLKRIKNYIYKNACYDINPGKDDIRGIFSPDDLKAIIDIIEEDLWIERYGLFYSM